MLISTDNYKPDLQQNSGQDIPTGTYKVLIEDAEFKNAGNGNYRGLNLTYKIQDGDYKSETLKEWIANGVINPESNPKVVEWGLNKILGLAIILGITGDLNEDKIENEFKGRALYLEVSFDGSKDRYKNSVEKHISLDDYSVNSIEQGGVNLNNPLSPFNTPKDSPFSQQTAGQVGNHEIPPHQ